jgi:hypothetical protein
MIDARDRCQIHVGIEVPSAKERLVE